MGTRDERGRFLPGCPPGPGRPSRPRELAYLEALGQVATLDRWRRIVEQWLADCEDANPDVRQRTRALLAAYLVGRPRKTASVSTEGASIFEELARMSDAELEATIAEVEANSGGAGGDGAPRACAAASD